MGTVERILAVLAIASLAAAGPEAQVSGRTIRGRVLDPRGVPLAGAALALKDDPKSVLARTDSDGTFELPAGELPPRAQLRIAEGQTVCTAVGAVSGLCGPTGDYLLVGASARTLSGRVVDPIGEPIEGAELTALVDVRRLLLAFPQSLDSETLVAPQARSDAFGRFELEVPAVEGLTLWARSAGCASVRTWIESRSTRELEPFELTLRRTTAPWRRSGALHGRVVRLDGSPAQGARVVLGREEAWADEQGWFSAEMLRGYGPGDALCAVLPGVMPFVSFDPANELGAFGTLEAPLVLTLGEPSLSIAGRVFDHLGNPCAGWLVELADGTAVSLSSQPGLRVEHLTGGRPTGNAARTDSKGAFRIDGLMQRPYVLQAEPQWLSGYEAVMVRSVPIQAGTSEVELRLEPEPWIAPFRGRLVELDGTPLAGERVALYLEASLSWTRENGDLEDATTDLEGRFEMERVAKTGSYFVVGTTSLPLSACSATGGEWTLSIARWPNLRFDWKRAPSPPIELTALDAQGSALPIHTFVAGKPDTCFLALDLDGVRSHLLAVQSSLASLRMRFADGSIESLPVQLEPSGLTEIAIE